MTRFRWVPCSESQSFSPMLDICNQAMKVQCHGAAKPTSNKICVWGVSWTFQWLLPFPAIIAPNLQVKNATGKEYGRKVWPPIRQKKVKAFYGQFWKKLNIAIAFRITMFKMGGFINVSIEVNEWVPIQSVWEDFWLTRGQYGWIPLCIFQWNLSYLIRAWAGSLGRFGDGGSMRDCVFLLDRVVGRASSKLEG